MEYITDHSDPGIAPAAVRRAVSVSDLMVFCNLTRVMRGCLCCAQCNNACATTDEQAATSYCSYSTAAAWLLHTGDTQEDATRSRKFEAAACLHSSNQPIVV